MFFRGEFPPSERDGYFDRCLNRRHVSHAIIGDLVLLRALGHTRRRQVPYIFADAAFYLGSAPPPSRLGYFTQDTRTDRPSPPFQLRDRPVALFANATVAPLCVVRPMPLYSHPTDAPYRVGRKRRA